MDNGGSYRSGVGGWRACYFPPGVGTDLEFVIQGVVANPLKLAVQELASNHTSISM